MALLSAPAALEGDNTIASLYCVGKMIRLAILIPFRSLAESLLSLCGSYPGSLVQNQQEIIEFLTIFQNRDSGGDDLYTNLVGDVAAHMHL